MIEIRARLADRPSDRNSTPLVKFEAGEFCHNYNMTHLVMPVYGGSCYRCFVCGLYLNGIDTARDPASL